MILIFIHKLESVLAILNLADFTQHNVLKFFIFLQKSGLHCFRLSYIPLNKHTHTFLIHSSNERQFVFCIGTCCNKLWLILALAFQMPTTGTAGIAVTSGKVFFLVWDVMWVQVCTALVTMESQWTTLGSEYFTWATSLAPFEIGFHYAVPAPSWQYL